MISGIGIDMIEVDRVAEKIGKEKGFRELVFSANEIAYCETKTNKYEHYAARFAAKEAFLKALGTGWANGFAFNEIEIYHDTNGKPLLQLLGNTALQVAAINIRQIAVSLTHVKSIASAIIIIEG
jgi:holo-[acyl-carrier protein] synthase